MGKVIELEAYENIPEYVGFKNTTSIEIEDGYEWNGHSYGVCVGMIEDNGTVISYFKKDNKKKNTELFDMLKNDICLIKKHVNLINNHTFKSKSGIRYFIPYKVKGHCSNKPTITDDYVDNCMNVKYSVEYEILLAAGDGLKRYITIDYKTKGPGSLCFFDQIKDTTDEFEEYFEEGLYGFKMDEEGNKSVDFYDETGEKYDIGIDSIDDLKRMIASIRVIKCESTII